MFFLIILTTNQVITREEDGVTIPDSGDVLTEPEYFINYTVKSFYNR